MPLVFYLATIKAHFACLIFTKSKIDSLTFIADFAFFIFKR